MYCTCTVGNVTYTVGHVTYTVGNVTYTVGHVTDFISYIQGKIVLPTAACMKVTMEIKYVY